jgi:hypothetical protein
MKLWSQLARLGAAVAALAPAVAQADDEPDQVEMPTLDITNQPVAVATIGAASVDPDASLLEDMVINPKLHVASLPLATQLPPLPEDRTPGPPRTSPKGAGKAHPNVMAHSKSWHGGGQRYGG